MLTAREAKIAASFERLIVAAKRLGMAAADAYGEEFGESPTRETAGDRDAAAWETQRKELADEGMTNDTYSLALEAWRSGFFGQ
jgi:hypothetical protein